MAGRLTAEQLTKFLLYAEWVVHATWWVGDHWGSLCDAVGACHRVFDLLDRPTAMQLSQAGEGKWVGVQQRGAEHSTARHSMARHHTARHRMFILLDRPPAEQPSQAAEWECVNGLYLLGV